MQKRAPEAFVAQRFTHATIASAQAGDLVSLTADMTVDCVASGDVLGEVVTVDKYEGFVTVELRATKIKEMIAAAQVNYGQRVKLSTTKIYGAQTILPVVGPVLTAGSADTFTVGTPDVFTAGSADTFADDTKLAFGVALNSGAIGATIFVAVR